VPSEVSDLPRAWLSSTVYAELTQEADRHAPNETGGVLIGYWAGKPAEPVILLGVGPGPKAKHSPSRFVPDYDFHEQEVARHFESSGGRLSYLGDWHSHPNAPGNLSKTDCGTLSRIARSRRARAPRPLMLILAFGPVWEPCIWGLRQRRRAGIFSSLILERWRATCFEPVE
jgi:integrative and conjugative element protein (TIGR02256 family)